MAAVATNLYQHGTSSSGSSYLDDYFNQQDQNQQSDLGMNIEILRLASFKNWPRWAPVLPNRLAHAGFYYLETADQTKCFCCGGIVKQWHHKDRPQDRHRRVTPNCPFVCGRQTSNIPLPGSADTTEGPPGPSPRDQIRSVGQQQNATVTHFPSSLPGTSQRSVVAVISDYQSEETRLSSFEEWPANAFLPPDELAQAGFFYVGPADRVQCAFCKGILKKWDPGDRAFAEHEKHFPLCPFVQNPEGANIETRSSNNRLQSNTSTTVNQLSAFGIETEMPKNHDYALLESRKASFINWSPANTQRPDVLAEAGFYYAGQDDSVKCFWCDGGLRNWESGDDPWVEHAKWFPRCSHVKRVKGSSFIERVQLNSESQSGQVTGSSNASGLRRIDQREVTARMDTTSVKRVLEMGFEPAFVRKVMEYRLRTTGDDFSGAEELLETVMRFKDSPPLDFPLPPQSPPPQRRESPTSSAGISTPMETSNVSKDQTITAKSATTSEASTSQSENGSKKNKKKKKKGKGNANEQEKMEVEEEKNENAETLNQKAPECKVCMDAEVNIVFLPCGHLVCCSNCAPALKFCPICRGLIRGTVNVFMS